nr:YwqG family protein [Actinacidiphila rubida]
MVWGDRGTRYWPIRLDDLAAGRFGRPGSPGGAAERAAAAGGPAPGHQVCSAARTSISLTATRRSRVTM